MCHLVCISNKPAEQQKIQESDITGLAYFNQLVPLLKRLHEHGCARDRAGNRVLHYDQYCLLLLLYLFPVPQEPSHSSPCTFKSRAEQDWACPLWFV
jgi:hypothetical protein